MICVFSIDDDYIMEGQGLLSEISSLELMKNLGGPIEDVSLTNQKSHEVTTFQQLTILLILNFYNRKLSSQAT